MLDNMVEEHVAHVLYEIKSHRLKRRISQTDIAAQLGISVSSYCKFERKQLRIPYDLLLKVISIIEVPSDILRLPQMKEPGDEKINAREINKKLNSIISMISGQNKKG